MIALLIDLVFDEPPRSIHPVVWSGWAIDRFDWRREGSPRAQVARGAAATAAMLIGSLGASIVVVRILALLPPLPRLLFEAWLLKTALSLRGLVAAANLVGHHLMDGNLAAARLDVQALVSRDSSSLDEAGLTSAVVESLAENVPDSVLAPLLFYVLGGLPAAAAYRTANTLDAMVGYHGTYEFSGKFAARVDDALSFIPSRFAAGLIVGAAAIAGGHPNAALAALRADCRATESPNAGWPMSAMAGALGVRLEKVGEYRLAAHLPAPDVSAIDHAVQIVYAATALALPPLLALARAVERRGQ